MRAHFKWSWFLLLAYALLFACGSALVSSRGPRVSTSKLKASVVSQEDGKFSFLALYPGSCLKDSSKEIKLYLVANNCKFEMRWDEKRFFFDVRAIDHNEANVLVDASNGKFRLGFSSEIDMSCEVEFNPNNNTEQGGYVVDINIEKIVKTCSDIEIEFGDRYELYVPPRPSTPEDEKKMRDTTLVVVFSVLGSLSLLIALGFSLYYCWWKKRGLKQGATGPTQVVVPAQKPKPSQINRTSNVPEVTAISKTHVKTQTTQPQPTPFAVPAPVLPPVLAPVSDQVSDQVPAPVNVIDETPLSLSLKKLKTIPVSRIPTPIIIKGARTKASEEMSEKLYGGLNDFSETMLVPNTIEMEAFDRKLARSRRNAIAVDEDEQKQKNKKHWSKNKEELAPNTTDVEEFNRQCDKSRRDAMAVDEGEQKQKNKKPWSKNKEELVPNNTDVEEFNRRRDKSRRHARAVDEGEQKRKKKKYRS